MNSNSNGAGRVVGTTQPYGAGALLLVPMVAVLASVGAGDTAFPTDSLSVNQRASIHGSVTFAGSVPDADVIDMSMHRFCAAAHAGQRVTSQPISADANGRLTNVLIYVKEGLISRSFPDPVGEVVLDQRNCRYAPHVVALRTGQTLVIRNSDRTLHNVHVTAANNRGFNIGQPLPGIESKRTFANPEIGIDVACDVHRWMSAVIAVFDHPFFAVTSENGEFTLEDLPPGDYVIEAWHETLGAKTETVTVGAAGSAEVSFVF